MSRLWLTGASSGIGAALAERLLAEGHSLAVTARQAAPLQALAQRHGARVLVVPGDITDAGQVREIVRRIEQAWGRWIAWCSMPGPANTSSPAVSTRRWWSAW